jgi:hypothetical protein
VSALADLVLVVHFGFVLFVVGGFALVLVGATLGWRWVRARGFRLAHLAAIVFVALESLAGIVCPLTAWEDALRGSKDQSSFVARWIARLLYYDFPEWVFAAAYVAFAVAVAAAWRLVPPRRREFPPPDDAGLR